MSGAQMVALGLPDPGRHLGPNKKSPTRKKSPAKKSPNNTTLKRNPIPNYKDDPEGTLSAALGQFVAAGLIPKSTLSPGNIAKLVKKNSSNGRSRSRSPSKNVTDLHKKYLKSDLKKTEQLATLVAEYLPPKELPPLRNVNKQHRRATDAMITALVRKGTHVYHTGKNNDLKKMFGANLSDDTFDPAKSQFCDGNKNVTDIIFQPNITKIGRFAFICHVKLSEVVIPEKVKEIEYSAFGACTKLEKVTFPKSLRAIYNKAFLGCKELKEVDLSHTDLRGIGDEVFSENEKLTKIIFPPTLHTILSSAFNNCLSLKEIDLSETNVSKIVKKTFKNCTGLTTVRFPKKLKTISDDAFEACGALKHVYFYKNCPYLKSSTPIPQWLNGLNIKMI